MVVTCNILLHVNIRNAKMAENKGLFEIVKATRKATRKTRKATEAITVSEDAKARFAHFIRFVDKARDMGKGYSAAYCDADGNKIMTEDKAKRIARNMIASGMFDGIVLTVKAQGNGFSILGHFKRERVKADGIAY